MLKIDATNSKVGALASNLTDNTATTLIAAQGTGTRLRLESIIVTNSATATVVRILSGSTELFRLNVAEDGGFALPFNVPVYLGENEALRIQAVNASGHELQAVATAVVISTARGE